MSEVKVSVEQVRVRGKNFADVVSQLVDKYNSSNGWAVLRVIPSVLSLEVILERSSEQVETKEEPKKAANQEESKPKQEPKKAAAKKSAPEKEATADKKPQQTETTSSKTASK